MTYNNYTCERLLKKFKGISYRGIELLPVFKEITVLEKKDYYAGFEFTVNGNVYQCGDALGDKKEDDVIQLIGALFLCVVKDIDSFIGKKKV